MDHFLHNSIATANSMMWCIDIFWFNCAADVHPKREKFNWKISFHKTQQHWPLVVVHTIAHCFVSSILNIQFYIIRLIATHFCIVEWYSIEWGSVWGRIQQKRPIEMRLNSLTVNCFELLLIAWCVANQHFRKLFIPE